MIEVYKCPKDLWAQYVENLYVLKQEEDTQVSLQQLPHIQKPNFVCKIKPPANLLKTSCDFLFKDFFYRKSLLVDETLKARISGFNHTLKPNI